MFLKFFWQPEACFEEGLPWNFVKPTFQVSVMCDLLAVFFLLIVGWSRPLTQPDIYRNKSWLYWRWTEAPVMFFPHSLFPPSSTFLISVFKYWIITAASAWVLCWKTTVIYLRSYWFKGLNEVFFTEVEETYDLESFVWTIWLQQSWNGCRGYVILSFLLLAVFKWSKWWIFTDCDLLWRVEQLFWVFFWSRPHEQIIFCYLFFIYLLMWQICVSPPVVCDSSCKAKFR